MPSDSVTLMQTNPTFIAAYLAGLNSALGHELLWRGYPTDERGTYWYSFWGVGPEIRPLHRFSGALPDNVAGSAQPLLVLVLRGRLLRRYPDSDIYAVLAGTAGDAPDLDAATTTVVHPLFRDFLDPDFTLAGFPLTYNDVVGTARRPGLLVRHRGASRPPAVRAGRPRSGGDASARPELGRAHLERPRRGRPLSAVSPRRRTADGPGRHNANVGRHGRRHGRDHLPARRARGHPRPRSAEGDLRMSPDPNAAPGPVDATIAALRAKAAQQRSQVDGAQNAAQRAAALAALAATRDKIRRRSARSSPPTSSRASTRTCRSPCSRSDSRHGSPSPAPWATSCTSGSSPTTCTRTATTRP